MSLTRDDIISVIGPTDEATLAAIAATGATVDELREAAAWLGNDEPLVNAHRPLPGARVAILIELLEEPVDEP
jgi:hypothetical protein